MLDKLRQPAPALAATFEGARPVGVDDEETLTIGFPAELDLQQTQGRGARASASRWPRRCEAVTGERLRPVYVLLDGEAPRAEEAPAERGRSTTMRWWRS